MQTALGEQWEALAPALRKHYQLGANTDIGRLDIEYPVYMHPYLSLLHRFGALINRRGRNLDTTVEKTMVDDIQHWRRTVRLASGRNVYFTSFWLSTGKGELVEYVNPFMGLRMAVHVEDGNLHYSGCSIVLINPATIYIAFRASSMRWIKAQCAANGHSIGKCCNAEPAHA